jgi:hypothetical protein
MLKRELSIAVLAATVAIACGAQNSPGISRGLGGDDSKGPPTSNRDLIRDLEATVLEGYMQLTLGNIEAYADGIARDRDIALIGIAPRAVVVGRNPRAVSRDRRPFRGIDAKFYSKNLDVHLARDGAVGWTFDEVSYRVRFLDREASIPIRVTSIFVRDIDRWVLVHEHMSYALPIEEVIALARAGRLRSPRALCKKKKCDSESPGLPRIVEALLASKGKERYQRLASADQALLVWPGPEHEYHGREVNDAPPLAELFGLGAKVSIHDYRAYVGPGRKVAWVVANLEVSSVDGELTIGLRATYVLSVARVGTNKFSWKIVQSHVSVPIDAGELSRRVFGEGPATPGR